MKTSTADLIEWRDHLRAIQEQQIAVRHANPGRTLAQDIKQADDSRDILSKGLGLLAGILSYRIEEAQAKRPRVKEAGMTPADAFARGRQIIKGEPHV